MEWGTWCSTIYLWYGFHLISFLTLSGSRFSIFLDTLLRRAGVLCMARLDFLSGLLSGLLSSAVEKASDVADSLCIQSHLLRFPIKSWGTLPWRRARANSCQPWGWNVFRCLTTSFTKSAMLLPLTTSPLYTNSPRSFQLMLGWCLILSSIVCALCFHLLGTRLRTSCSVLFDGTSPDEEAAVLFRWSWYSR